MSGESPKWSFSTEPCFRVESFRSRPLFQRKPNEKSIPPKGRHIGLPPFHTQKSWCRRCLSWVFGFGSFHETVVSPLPMDQETPPQEKIKANWRESLLSIDLRFIQHATNNYFQDALFFLRHFRNLSPTLPPPQKKTRDECVALVGIDGYTPEV